jgi:deaminated glutathione amidase
MIRVAVLQIEHELEPTSAVALCARLIDRAVSEQSAQIVVFPQLTAHDDDVDAVDSQLARELSRLSAQHAIWVLGSVSIASSPVCVWADPSGQVHARPCSELEQTGAGSFGAETALLSTPYGKIGLCAGPSALRARVSRALSLAGAHLVCTSLAVSLPRVLSLQPPARAVENQIFVAVSALYVAHVAPYPTHMETLPPPQHGADSARLHNQIAGPNGQLVVLTSCAEGSISIAELALGTPEPLSDAEQTSPSKAGEESIPAAPPRSLFSHVDRSDRSVDTAVRSYADDLRASTLTVATLTIEREGSLQDTLTRTAEQLRDLAKQDVSLVVLPELFCFGPELSCPENAAAEFVNVVRTLAEACTRSRMHVVTSLVEQVKDRLFHTAVLVGQGGVVVRQVSLARASRLPWATPGRRVQTARLPWGRLALSVGDDALLPEFAESLSQAGVDVLAAPLAAAHAEHARLTLPAMAEEGRYAVVAALTSAPAPEAHRSTEDRETSEEGQPGGGFIVDPSQLSLHVASKDELGLRATLDLSALRSSR